MESRQARLLQALEILNGFCLSVMALAYEVTRFTSGKGGFDIIQQLYKLIGGEHHGVGVLQEHGVPPFASHNATER